MYNLFKRSPNGNTVSERKEVKAEVHIYTDTTTFTDRDKTRN